MKNWAFIINPASGSRDKLILAENIRRLAELKSLKYHIVMSQSKGDERIQALSMIAEGFRNVASFGGDGTNHNVINGVLQSGIGEQVHYAHFPCGTGNDWAETLGLTADLSIFLDKLSDSRIFKQDVCKVVSPIHEKYVVNILGAGFDSSVVEFIEENVTKKNKFTYTRAIMSQIAQYRAEEMKLHFDDNLFEGLVYSLHVGISHRSGGGQIVLPHVKERKHKMAYNLVLPTSKWVLFSSLGKLKTGNIEKLPFVRLGYAEKVVIDNDNVIAEADGELIGHGPFTVTLIPDALLVVDTRD